MCSTESCDRDVYAKGICKRCYSRKRRSGTVEYHVRGKMGPNKRIYEDEGSDDYSSTHDISRDQSCLANIQINSILGDFN